MTTTRHIDIDKNKGGMKMNRQKEKEIAELRKVLHDIANNQPSCDPFSYVGAQAWQEWSQGCRDAEKALTDTEEEL